MTTMTYFKALYLVLIHIAIGAAFVAPMCAIALAIICGLIALQDMQITQTWNDKR